jgi:phosphoribosylaminoimidazolecarboxamide formyltransferase/IMP cyclohydrolase
MQPRRILPPHDVQEWQKHLYRFIHKSPGMALPPLDGKSTLPPIRFNVISDATKLVEIPSPTGAAIRLPAPAVGQVSASKSAPASVSPPVSIYNASSGSMNASSPAVGLGTSSPSSLYLRYGTNPNQSPALVYMKGGSGLPISVLGGSPGYINLLDAFNSWQLVKELKTALGLPAAASFKHVSPAGAAIATPLTESLRKTYFVDDLELSPLATAYARARGADRFCSFGDFIALSDTVDVPTARLIAREVSDGVIAPAYEPEALEILRKKKQGKYAILQVEPAFEPPAVETRDVFGVTLEQHRNDRPVTPADFSNIVTQNKILLPEAIQNLTIAWITLKYTQSNSVCFVADGQTIGVGAGQQSRIHCVRLAAQKADLWRLRQHPAVLALPFRVGIKRPERDNAIDQFLRDDITPAEKTFWNEVFTEIPQQITLEEKRAWLGGLTDVTLGSDAFFPFADSIHRAAASGVKYVLEPGGSTRDAEIIAAANAYGMTMVFSGVRLFHH